MQAGLGLSSPQEDVIRWIIFVFVEVCRKSVSFHPAFDTVLSSRQGGLFGMLGRSLVS